MATPASAAAEHLKGTSSGHPITILTSDVASRLPTYSLDLFQLKEEHNLSFEKIGQAIGRDEIMAAAIFYGQAQATEGDIQALANLFNTGHQDLRKTGLGSIPDRGRLMDMPPREPLMYRLYEIVQNYGYAFKAVINEKFGDGIMSAISFTMKVDKETDDKGEWVKITLRGKWLPYTRF